MKIKFKLTLIHVLISLFIFIGFVAAVLPNEAAAGLANGLTESIDTSLFYTPSRLYQIISSYTREVRLLYIYQRFTFDLVWPLVYGLFIVITIWYLIDKNNLKYKKEIKLIPIMAVGFDFLENILVSVLMYLYPFQSYFLAAIASAFTFLKWLTLSLSFILILALFLQQLTKFIFGKLGR